MSSPGIDLPWAKHERGYVVQRKRTTQRIAFSGAVGRWHEDYIVGERGPLTGTQPLRDYDGLLYKEFVKLYDAAGVLSFVRRFGPLTGEGLNGGGERIAGIIDQANHMRRYVDSESKRKPSFKDLLPPAGLALGELSATLVHSRTSGRVELKLTPKDLMTGIWLQFGYALASGQKIRRCGHCSELFEAGPGSDRRLDAKFCSEEHKIAFHSLARTRRN